MVVESGGIEAYVCRTSFDLTSQTLERNNQVLKRLQNPYRVINSSFFDGLQKGVPWLIGFGDLEFNVFGARDGYPLLFSMTHMFTAYAAHAANLIQPGQSVVDYNCESAILGNYAVKHTDARLVVLADERTESIAWASGGVLFNNHVTESEVDLVEKTSQSTVYNVNNTNVELAIGKPNETLETRTFDHVFVTFPFVPTVFEHKPRLITEAIELAKSTGAMLHVAHSSLAASLVENAINSFGGRTANTASKKMRFSVELNSKPTTPSIVELSDMLRPYGIEVEGNGESANLFHYQKLTTVSF